MSRNYGLISAEEHDKGVKESFTLGLWTGASLVTLFWASVIFATLYYLGATH